MSITYIEDAVSGIRKVISRFPVTSLWAFIITGCALYGNYTEEWKPGLVTTIMVGGLGFSTTLVGHLVSEVYSSSKKWAAWLIILIFLGINFWYWYGVLDSYTFNICSSVLYCGLLTLSILLVSLCPYGKKEFNNQWLLTFNRQVFTSYVFTWLLSTILYIALALAVLVVNNLFNLNIDEKIYLYLMVFIAGIIWTFLLLHSIPSLFNDESTSSYPAFRFIIQYIGVPVVIVYAVILVFYASANLFMQQQMEEWILWLILWFYILGFLIFCLNYSVKDSNETSWSNWFCKWYLWGSIPISLLNIIGLWRAISDQGVSELTHILATFSVFLLMASCYLIWSERKDFRLVLLFLFVLIMISTIGPFNMCKATVSSQTVKLKSMLIENEMLINGKLQSASSATRPENFDISSKLELLNNRGKLSQLKQWDSNQLLGDEPYELGKINEALNLIDPYISFDQRISIQGDLNRSIDIEEFERIIPLRILFPGEAGDGINLYYIQDQSYLSLYIDGEEKEKYYLADYFNADNIKESVIWNLQSERYEIQIHILSAELNNDLSILNINGIALFKTTNNEN